MRKLLFSLLAMLFLMGSSAGMVAAQDDEATPADDSAPAAEGENPRDPQIGDTVTVYSEQGDPLAEITVTNVERGWEGYDEYSEPARGQEILAVSVEVVNLAERSSYEFAEYDFGVQDAMGHYWGTGYVSVAEEPEPPLLESSVTLEGEASEEFTLLFVIYDDVPLNYLYFQQSGTLVTLVDLSEA